jgi:hypothetical protein
MLASLNNISFSAEKLRSDIALGTGEVNAVRSILEKEQHSIEILKKTYNKINEKTNYYINLRNSTLNNNDNYIISFKEIKKILGDKTAQKLKEMTIDFHEKAIQNLSKQASSMKRKALLFLLEEHAGSLKLAQDEEELKFLSHQIKNQPEGQKIKTIFHNIFEEIIKKSLDELNSIMRKIKEIESENQKRSETIENKEKKISYERSILTNVKNERINENNALKNLQNQIKRSDEDEQELKKLIEQKRLRDLQEDMSEGIHLMDVDDTDLKTKEVKKTDMGCTSGYCNIF